MTIILVLTFDIYVCKINTFNIINYLIRFTFIFYQVMNSKERVIYLYFLIHKYIDSTNER